jgi:hypothetical protein
MSGVAGTMRTDMTEVRLQLKTRANGLWEQGARGSFAERPQPTACSYTEVDGSGVTASRARACVAFKQRKERYIFGHADAVLLEAFRVGKYTTLQAGRKKGTNVNVNAEDHGCSGGRLYPVRVATFEVGHTSHPHWDGHDAITLFFDCAIPHFWTAALAASTCGVGCGRSHGPCIFWRLAQDPLCMELNHVGTAWLHIAVHGVAPDQGTGSLDRLWESSLQTKA